MPAGPLPLLVFAVVLLAAALLSGLARRSVLSTAVMFLVAGFLTGSSMLGLLPIGPMDSRVAGFAEVALFSVLFIDALQLSGRRLQAAWRLSGRALLVGVPLTAAVLTMLGHMLAGLSWSGAALVGVALSPTDPVLAAAIVGAPQVPGRLRELLNVESGLNDGLALPLVIALLAVNGEGSASPLAAIAEAGLGIAIGAGVCWIAVRLVRTPVFEVADAFVPIGVLAVALIVFSASRLLEANEFLAAFAAGVTLTSMTDRARPAFEPLGGPLSEVLKLAAVLVFGALVTPDLLRSLQPMDYLFAVLALAVARPLAMAVALIRTELTRRERLVAAWFGPKGFASVFFAFLVIDAGIPGAERLFQLLALVIAASIVAHSSTDVLVSRWFED